LDAFAADLALAEPSLGQRVRRQPAWIGVIAMTPA
jgi:hypothetical protein